MEAFDDDSGDFEEVEEEEEATTVPELQSKLDYLMKQRDEELSDHIRSLFPHIVSSLHQAPKNSLKKRKRTCDESALLTSLHTLFLRRRFSSSELL